MVIHWDFIVDVMGSHWMTMRKSKERSHLKTIKQKCDGNPQGCRKILGKIYLDLKIYGYFSLQ